VNKKSINSLIEEYVVWRENPEHLTRTRASRGKGYNVS